MRHPHIAGMSLAIAALAACGLVTDPAVQQLGIIEFAEPPQHSVVLSELLDGSPTGYQMAQVALELPDTVIAGEEFRIVVRTYGPDSCWSAGNTDVARSPSKISLIAYDEKASEGYCLMAPVQLERTIRAAFSEQGLQTVELTGLRLYPGESRSDTVTIARVVVVK